MPVDHTADAALQLEARFSARTVFISRANVVLTSALQGYQGLTTKAGKKQGRRKDYQWMS